MTYPCGQCHKEVKMIRLDLDNEPKIWKCNTCYFSPKKKTPVKASPKRLH